MNRAELENRLERLAAVRPQVVARGKKLVADPNYPDQQTIRKMSHLLAGKLSQ